MCNRFKLALERLAGPDDLYFHPIQEREIFSQIPELDEAQCHDTVHLISEDQAVLKGPEVVEFLAKRLPGVKKFAWLLDNEAGKKAVELFYNAVNEYRKSSLNSCQSCKRN